VSDDNFSGSNNFEGDEQYNIHSTPRLTSQPIRDSVSDALEASSPGVNVHFTQDANTDNVIIVTLRTRPSQPVTVFVKGDHAHIFASPAQTEIDPARFSSQYFIRLSLRLEGDYPPPADGSYQVFLTVSSGDPAYNSKRAEFKGFFINGGALKKECTLPFLTAAQLAARVRNRFGGDSNA